MKLGTLALTTSRALLWRDEEELKFYAENGQMAVFQASIRHLPEGAPVIYLGQIEQKLIRTKAAKEVSILEDGSFVPSVPRETTEYPIARVLTSLGIGYMLFLKMKASDETG